MKKFVIALLAAVTTIGVAYATQVTPKTETVCVTATVKTAPNKVDVNKRCVVRLTPSAMQKRMRTSEHSEKTNR